MSARAASPRWLGILTLLSLAGTASARELPSRTPPRIPPWIPAPIRAKLRSASKAFSGDQPGAELFLCAPYCELVGTFRAGGEFRPASRDLVEEAGRPENSERLHLVLDPGGIGASDHLVRAHLPENPPAGARDQEPSKETGAADTGDEMPLFVGGHLDALLSAMSLQTSANTDTASDARAHGLFGGGVDFDLRGLGSLGGGSFSAAADLSFWGSLGQQSALGTGQSWESQIFAALLGAYWQKSGSPWRLGVVLEGRQEIEDASPNTAIGFSSTYDWASAGLSVRYRQAELHLLQSVIGRVQDIAQYRGSGVSSSRTAIEGDFCRGFARVLDGEFQLCGYGLLSFIHATGAGTPLQPVFTVNPAYLYSEWQGGLQFRVVGISL